MFVGGMMAIVVAATATRMSTAAVNTGMLAGVTAAALVPYVLYVAWAEGVAWRVAASFEFAKGESHQFGLYQPPLRMGALLPATGVPAEPIDGASFLYYLSYALIAATIVLLVLRWRRIHAHHRPVLLGLVALQQLQGRLRARVTRCFATQPVDRAVARGGDDPARRRRRDAALRPALQCGGERVLHGFLGQGNIPELAHEYGHGAAVLAPEYLSDLVGQ
jgi:hypothetical protein